jgi:hypothetical protein
MMGNEASGPGLIWSAGVESWLQQPPLPSKSRELTMLEVLCIPTVPYDDDEASEEPIPDATFLAEQLDVVQQSLEHIETILEQLVEQALSNQLKFDDARYRVILGGQRYHIEDPTVYLIFKKIAEASPQIVPHAVIEALPGCKGRIDRKLKHLPETLQAVLKSRAGPTGGYWIDISALD